MSPEQILPWLLVAQGVVGGTDTLLNHELVERLPHRAEAHSELGWHALREAIYGALFIGLAGFAWHGAAAWVVAGLLAIEVLDTMADEYIENRIRVLPQNERLMHVFLVLNLGLIIACLVPILLEWHGHATAVERQSYGVLAWVVTVLGLASLVWSARDALAWRRLTRVVRAHGQAAR